MSLAIPSYTANLLGQTIGALGTSSRAGTSPVLPSFTSPVTTTSAPELSATTDLASHLDAQRASAASAADGLDTVRQALDQARRLSLAMDKASGADLVELRRRYETISASVADTAATLEPLGKGLASDHMARRIHALVTDAVRTSAQALADDGTVAAIAEADQQVRQAAQALQDLAAQVQRAGQAAGAARAAAAPALDALGLDDGATAARSQAVALLAGLPSYGMASRVFSTLA